MKIFQRLFLAFLIASAFNEGSTAVFSAADREAQAGGNLFVLHDRLGNAIAVSNRFDGNGYFVQTTQFNPSGGTNWNRIHYDSYQERANAVSLDANGNIYIVGARYMQGSKVFWIMKYSSAGDLLWERADMGYQSCAAFGVVANEAGDSWVAGSCVKDGRYPVRLLRYDPSGYSLWGQVFDQGGRNYVRGVSLDFNDRVSVNAEVNSGVFGNGPPLVRTVVYNKEGGQVTVY